MEKKQITFIDYLSVLIKWRKFIVINFFVVCVIAAVISLILPKWFTASTTIMPPTSDGGSFGVSSLLNNLPVGGLGAGLGAVSEETNNFIAIINSRTVMASVIEKFNLIELYKTENMEETIKALRDHVSTELNDEGTVSVEVEAGTSFFAGEDEDDEAREMAKNMANYFIEEVDRVNKKLKTEKATNTRIFIERRYLQNLEDMKKAEEAFKEFQEKYGAIAFPEQTQAAILTASEIKASIIAKEAEVDVIQNYVNETHPNLLRLQAELNALKGKYDEFLSGRGKDISDSSTTDLFLPFKDVPEIGVKYVRLYREVTLQEKLLEFLLPQYEQSKIQEAKDTPTIQVLDPAMTPIKKSRPKRMYIVLAAGFMSILFSVFAAYFSVNLEYIKITNEKRYQQIHNILTQLKPRNFFR